MSENKETAIKIALCSPFFTSTTRQNTKVIERKIDIEATRNLHDAEWSMPPKKNNGKNKIKPVSGQPSVLVLVSESSNKTPPKLDHQKKIEAHQLHQIWLHLVVTQRKGETSHKR